ncbi:hypothetical protein BKA93DRAFT_147042 [Sparassis latifolia]
MGAVGVADLTSVATVLCVFCVVTPRPPWPCQDRLCPPILGHMYTEVTQTPVLPHVMEKPTVRSSGTVQMGLIIAGRTRETGEPP